MPQVHTLELTRDPLKTQRQERAADTKLCQDDLDQLLQANVVTSHPQVVSGAFVFAGTRVPVYNLWDYLEAGDTVEDFLESFPTVPSALVAKAIELVGRCYERVSSLS